MHSQVIWRYGSSMKHFHFLSFLSIVALGAWAQPAPPSREAASAQLPPDVHRSELREALKKLQAQQAHENGPVVDAEALGSYDRHLTVQERADLRQQLRQVSVDSLLDERTK